MADKLKQRPFAVSVTMTKMKPGGIDLKSILRVVNAYSELEAKGYTVDIALSENEGYSVSTVLCAEIRNA